MVENEEQKAQPDVVKEKLLKDGFIDLVISGIQVRVFTVPELQNYINKKIDEDYGLLFAKLEAILAGKQGIMDLQLGTTGYHHSKKESRDKGIMEGIRLVKRVILGEDQKTN